MKSDKLLDIVQGNLFTYFGKWIGLRLTSVEVL